MSELYCYLTLSLGLSPEYVLDKMEFYEITALLKKSYMKDRQMWEATRILAFIIAQCNSSKKLNMKQIMKFDWDDENVKEISQKEIDDIAETAKMFETLLKNKI